jgi:hypothetical protein
MNKGPISARELDYGNAAGVRFSFPDVQAGFIVPNDVAVEEMAEVLERVAKNLRERKSTGYALRRHTKERNKRIVEMQAEEDAADA